nr:tetratricopeptide repeat protein [Leptolyngbya ohadii]
MRPQLRLICLVACVSAIGVSIDFLVPSFDSRAVAQSQNDSRRAEAIRLAQQGFQQLNTSQYSAALQSFQKALIIIREVGDRVSEGRILNNIGGAYQNQGQYPQALNSYQQALIIIREMGDRAGEGATLNNIGGVYQNQGQYPQALDYYQQALTIVREVGDRVQEGRTLNNIGQVYDNQGQYLQALDYYQQALNIIREVGDRVQEGATLNNIGLVYDNQGQYPQALDYYQQALVITREVGDRAGEGKTLNNIGAALLQTNQFAQASELLYAAIDVWESLRTAEMSDAAKVAIFETQADTYKFLQQALIAQNQPHQALEAAERGRGRALVALLSEQAAGNTTLENTAPSIDRIKQIARTQNATLVMYSQIYTVAGDRVLYIWVVKPTGEITFRQTSLTAQAGQPDTNPIASLSNNPIFRGDQPDATSALVANTRSSLRVGDATIGVVSTEASPTDRLRQLHQLLIEPIADLLPTNPDDRIVFVPQGSLFLVPFAALQDA